MSKLKEEKILVFPRKGLITKFLKQGCFNFNEENLTEIIPDAVYGTRHIIEENQNFKQIISYVAIINDGKVFVYKRGSAGGENKLHDLYSIGVGGHVDLENDDGKNAYDVIFDACIREVEEEVELTIQREYLKIKAYINDDSEANSGVGKVHFGLCFVVNEHFDLNKGELDNLKERVFMSKKEIEEIYDSLEEWSKLFYNEVIKELIN